MLCSLHGRPHALAVRVIRVLLRNRFLWQSNMGLLSLGAGKATFQMVSPTFNEASAPCWKASWVFGSEQVGSKRLQAEAPKQGLEQDSPRRALSYRLPRSVACVSTSSLISWQTLFR